MNADRTIKGLEEDVEFILNSDNDRLIIGRLASACSRLVGLVKDQDERVCIIKSELEEAQITIRELQGLCYSCGKNSVDKGGLCSECERSQFQALEQEASMAMQQGTKAISDDDWLD